VFSLNLMTFHTPSRSEVEDLGILGNDHEQKPSSPDTNKEEDGNSLKFKLVTVPDVTTPSTKEKTAAHQRTIKGYTSLRYFVQVLSALVRLALYLPWRSRAHLEMFFCSPPWSTLHAAIYLLFFLSLYLTSNSLYAFYLRTSMDPTRFGFKLLPLLFLWPHLMCIPWSDQKFTSTRPFLSIFRWEEAI